MKAAELWQCGNLSSILNGPAEGCVFCQTEMPQ